VTLNYRLIDNSLLITFLKAQSKKRYELLSESAISIIKFKKNTIDILISDNYIRATEQNGKYTITAKGIWLVELNNGMEYEEIINYIDKEYFNLFNSNENIQDKEKVVLFSMILIRSFSEKSALDFHNGQHTIDSWKEILDKTGSFLVEHNVIKNYPGNMYGKGGNEDPAIYLQERVNSLFKNSRGIYKTPGNRKYYLQLDITSDNDGNSCSIDKCNLIFLFWLIFKDKITFENFEVISDFCNQIAYEMSIHIYKEIGEHYFLNPDHDDIIREALFAAAESDHEW
jgi:hypothetical protein